ncbi:MAG: hypothetical protein ACLVAV_10315 [Clostridium sp.]
MNVSFPKCNQAGTEFVISTTDDLQEKVNYLSEDFPVAIFTQTITMLPVTPHLSTGTMSCN